jgi:integrase
MKQGRTIWEATDTPGLYTKRGGKAFYARITLNGKRTWRGLDTDKKREAQRRLRDLQSGHTRQVSTRTDDNLHAAMEKVMEFRAVRRGINRPLKKRTAGYHGEILGIAKKLFADKSLASFDTTGLLRGIQGCGYSQSRRKAVFELLKRTFADAVENGTIKKNPLAGQVPGQVPKKDRKLPTRDQLDEIMRVIPELYPRYGHRAVLSLRYLAFSGMRLLEARSVDWERDVSDNRITIIGTEDEGTKTGKTRILEINSPLQAVLDDIASMYGRKGRLMPAVNIRPQLAAACKKLKIPVIDHHDLRAWFITWGITSGVDVGTLAGWVGNSPKVLLERYLSVQNEQRRAAAAKLV